MPEWLDELKALVTKHDKPEPEPEPKPDPKPDPKPEPDPEPNPDDGPTLKELMDKMDQQNADYQEAFKLLATRPVVQTGNPSPGPKDEKPPEYSKMDHASLTKRLEWELKDGGGFEKDFVWVNPASFTATQQRLEAER